MLSRLLLLFLSLSSINLLSAQKTIAIKCGAVLNTRSGELLSNQVILVRGNLIESIVPAAGFNLKTDSSIDLSAFTVLPGLIDAHTHVLLQGDITSEDYDVQVLKESIPYRTIRAVRSAKQSLLNGFTTIRDLGTEGAGYADADIKKAIIKGEMEGPRMQIATLAINTTGHYPIKESDYAWELKLPKGLQEITGADEGRRAVREQIARGADWIKIYADRGYSRLADGSYRSLPNFTTEEINAIGDETLRSNRKLAAHAVTRDGIIAAIKAGASSIEHGFGMDDECIKLMVDKGIYWCPTIYVNEYVADGRAKAGSPMNKYFAESEAGLFKKALAAGVKVAYGTDIGGYDWQLSQARDFQFLVQYGMSPLQAIQTASIHAADLLGMSGKIGEIKKGAFADLVAVTGNPLKDVKILEAVKWVMKDGQVKK
jgi:imidazolonepropionase-like amidohydrolase